MQFPLPDISPIDRTLEVYTKIIGETPFTREEQENFRKYVATSIQYHQISNLRTFAHQVPLIKDWDPFLISNGMRILQDLLDRSGREAGLDDTLLTTPTLEQAAIRLADELLGEDE